MFFENSSFWLYYKRNIKEFLRRLQTGMTLRGVELVGGSYGPSYKAPPHSCRSSIPSSANHVPYNPVSPKPQPYEGSLHHLVHAPSYSRSIGPTRNVYSRRKPFGFTVEELPTFWFHFATVASYTSNITQNDIGNCFKACIVRLKPFNKASWKHCHLQGLILNEGSGSYAPTSSIVTLRNQGMWILNKEFARGLNTIPVCPSFHLAILS